MVKMKSVQGVQTILRLMGILRNYFSTAVGRYKNTAKVRHAKQNAAIKTWNQTASCKDNT